MGRYYNETFIKDSELVCDPKQFEKPWLEVSVDGKAVYGDNAPVKRKEANKLDFIQLPIEKQVQLVANEYNEGRGATEIRRNLGIKGAGTYYDRLDRAKAQGLVRANEAPQPIKVTEIIEEPVRVRAGTINLELFEEAASKKLAQAQKLSDDAERLRQARTIAQALTELLGDDASDLLDQLYEKVSA